tara:strand:+ start:358 stop:558 length:201 start_codon:yes stop_codon:yes gene_type:complete
MGRRKVYFTEEQFETLYQFVSEKVDSIVETSVQFQDSEVLNEWEDLLDVHSVLEEAEKWVLLEEEI